MRNEAINLVRTLLESSCDREKIFDDENEEEMLDTPETDEGDVEDVETPEDSDEGDVEDVEPTEEPEEGGEESEEPETEEADYVELAKEKLTDDLEKFGYIEYLEKMAKGNKEEADEILQNGYLEIYAETDEESNDAIKRGAEKAKEELGIEDED